MRTSVQISESSPEEQRKTTLVPRSQQKSHVQFQYWVKMSNGICLKVPEKSPGGVTVGEESTL